MAGDLRDRRCPDRQDSADVTRPGTLRGERRTAKGPVEGAGVIPHLSVVIQIVSCDLDHIVPGTQRIHFSRKFVGTQGCAAERRRLSCCLGSPYGIDADHCLFRIISFLR